MGGKGQRRREKNFKAAHGGYSRLPPPPKPTEIDTLPSKLRKIIDFTTSLTSPPTTTNKRTSLSPLFSIASNSLSFAGKFQTDSETKKNKQSNVSNGDKKGNLKVEPSSKKSKTKEEAKTKVNYYKDENDESDRDDKSDKKKAKRKKKQPRDLRGSYGAKKKEKRKKYAEAKKNKHKKAKIDEGQEFLGHEQIRFGDIVDAPPKLLAISKGVKKIPDASHERLRLKAVEAYRNRKGWGARPGVLLPPPITSDPSV